MPYKFYRPNDPARLSNDEYIVLAVALRALSVGNRASTVYIREIADCLERRALLAALILSTTLIEIWIRDLLVVRQATIAIDPASPYFRHHIASHRMIDKSKVMSVDSDSRRCASCSWNLTFSPSMSIRTWSLFTMRSERHSIMASPAAFLIRMMTPGKG